MNAFAITFIVALGITALAAEPRFESEAIGLSFDYPDNWSDDVEVRDEVKRVLELIDSWQRNAGEPDEPLSAYMRKLASSHHIVLAVRGKRIIAGKDYYPMANVALIPLPPHLLKEPDLGQLEKSILRAEQRESPRPIVRSIPENMFRHEHVRGHHVIKTKPGSTKNTYRFLYVRRPFAVVVTFVYLKEQDKKVIHDMIKSLKVTNPPNAQQAPLKEE